MKRLAILVSISLVIGIPLSYGCKNLNRIKIEEASTTESSNQSNWEEEVNTTKSESNSNWVEEFNKLEKEIEQERLESDIEWEIYKLVIGVDYEVSKQMMIDFLVDYYGYDRETVNKVINSIGWDWEYNCLVSYRKLLEEGHREDVIVEMLRGVDFTEEEIQYAIDNH